MECHNRATVELKGSAPSGVPGTVTDSGRQGSNTVDSGAAHPGFRH